MTTGGSRYPSGRHGSNANLPIDRRAHEPRQLLGGNRRRVVEALREVAADRGQDRARGGRLDALGDDPQAERAAERRRRGDDRAVGGIAVHRHHERLVDLELVDGQPLEMLERGVARAEVVEREAAAELLEIRQHLTGALWVVQHERFRDLECQHMWREAVTVEEVRYVPGGAEVEQV